MNNSGSPFAVLGLFDSAEGLLRAIPRIGGESNLRLEAYTPCPVRGLARLLGYRESPVGVMAFVMGVVGAAAALVLTYWANGWDYPLVTAGKAVFSWEAFVPIVFDTAVLSAALAGGVGMLVLLNRLPRLRHPMLSSRSMPLLTRDAFGLAVESTGGPLPVEALAAQLSAAGAFRVEVVDRLESTGPVSAKFRATAMGGILIVCLVAGYAAYWGIKLFPRMLPMARMTDQPRLDPQSESDFFKDGFGMRLPAAGTVSRDAVPYAISDWEEAAGLANPFPATGAIFRRGHESYDTHCAVCHGAIGDGSPTLTAAYGAKPANLVASAGRKLADGQIYHAIMVGKHAMSPYAADLNDAERWATVHYIRALQRAFNARADDFEAQDE